MHHDEAIPSFIHLGNTSKLRKRLHTNTFKSNTSPVDSAHSPRLRATSFATTSSTTNASNPQSSVDEATYILKHVSIRDRHPSHKRRGRPTSRIRGKHGSGKTFDPRYNSLRGHITSREKTKARSLHLQTYIHNRRLRLRQRLLHPHDQHSDDGSEQESSEMGDIMFAIDQEQYQRNLWEVEQRMQERTQSAAKSRSHFLMERRISAGEKVDRAQLVVQRQRTALEKRQLKVRHDLEQKMMQAMERRNAYLEAAIENDPSRRFRRKSQTNKDHETKTDNGSDRKVAPTSRAVAMATPGTTSTLAKRLPTTLRPPSDSSSSSSSSASVSCASVATRFPPLNNNNIIVNNPAKNSSLDMTTSNKTTLAHLTHLTTNPPTQTTSSINHNAIIPTDSNRSSKDNTESDSAPMDMDGGGDNNNSSGHGQHPFSFSSLSSASPLKLEEMAIWAQRRIRERLLVKAAQEYMQAIGSHDRVLALDFDPLARLLHTNKTLIQATLKLLRYSSQQVRMHRPDQPKRVYKAPARVFLSMYMVLAHPDQIRSPSEYNTHSLDDDTSFQLLVTSAKVLLESLERWVAAMTFTDEENSKPIATFGHNLLSDDQHRAMVVHQFDRAWASYYSMFEAWKARDAHRLLHTLLNHARHIEALWVTVNNDPTARLEWQPRIEEQRRDLREKAGQLAGAEGVAQLDAVFSDFMAATRPPIAHPPHHTMGPPRSGSFALPSSPPMGTTFAIPRSPPTLRPIMPAPPSSPAYPLTRLPVVPSRTTPSIDSTSDTTISAASSPQAHDIDVIMEEPPSEVVSPTPEATGIKRPRKKSIIAREAAEALQLTAESKSKGPRQRKKKVATNTKENAEADKINEAEATPKAIKKPRVKKTPKVDDKVDQTETVPNADDTQDRTEDANKVVKKPRANKTPKADDTQDQTEEAPNVVKKPRAKKTPRVDDAQDQTEEAPEADDTLDQTEEASKVKKPRAKKAPKVVENLDTQETVPKADGKPAASEETPNPVKKPRAKKAPKTVENPDQGETIHMATDGESEEAPMPVRKPQAKKVPKTDNPDEAETASIAVDGELIQEMEAPKVVKKPRAKKAPKTDDPDQEMVSMAVDVERVQEMETSKAIRKPRAMKAPKPDDPDQETVPMAVDGELDHAEETPKFKKPRVKKAPRPDDADQETMPIAVDGELVQEAPKAAKKPRSKKAPKTDELDQETIPLANDGELDQEEEEALKAVRKPRIRRAPRRADDDLDQETVPEDADEKDVKDASDKVEHTNWRGGPKYERYDKISPINFQNIEDKDSTDPVPGFEKPADWTKVKLIHELALDPNFKIESNRSTEGSGENSFEARIRAIATKAYFDSIREDAAQGQLGKWIPSILTRIREQLLEMVPSKSAIAMQMNEAFDLEFVQQQVDRNVFDVHGAIKTVLEMMSKLCAPVRDARLQKIQENLSQVSSSSSVSEPLKFSSESGNDLVSVLQDVLELLDDMLMDLANFRLMAARPSLEKQAIPYEQKAFKKALENKEVTMANVRVWLQKAADAEIEPSASTSGSTAGSGSVKSPSSPTSSVAPATWTAAFTPTKMLFNRHFAVFARAMFNLLFSAELIDMQENFPETFNLDRDRLVKYQNEIQALVLTAVLIQIGQTNAPPLQEAEQVELKDNLLALMEKPDTSIETLADCVIEAKESAILVRQSSSGSGSGQLLTPEQKGTLRNLVNSAVEIESPMFKVIWKRMRAVLESYAVAPRYTIAMPGKEELTKVGLNALSSEIDKLADSIRFLAKYNANVYHEWYDPMLTEMLPAQVVVHREREKK